ncbi:Cadherin domain protein [Planctomycetes bacterium MalM25]|nr:Cadherin domain protein [Planctomycetes bacterium MalM25]
MSHQVRPGHARRTPRLEPLEDRRLLAVTLQDFQDAGISARATNTLLQSQYAAAIVQDETLANVLEEIADTEVAPAGATLITSVAGLSQISAGTSNNPNVYLIQGDLTITSNIEVPSNVHLYVDGSLYKAGSHTRTSGQASENESDYIFRVRNAQNVKLIGVNNALLHSRANLDDQQGHATAVYVTGSSTNNVSVEGFEIGYVWEGLVARGGPKNVTFSDNYIHDTLKRAIWHLTSKDSVSVHNFVENAGYDGMDWDAFVDRSVGYENVVVGAGRWLGFVEEAAEDSAFIRNFGYMVDYGNPNADLVYQLGWVDHGTTSGVAAGGNQTQNNYFIDNVVFRPSGFSEGGQYYADLPPKGDTWFWANRGYANGSGLNMNYHGALTNAEWLTFVPNRDINFRTGVPTVADPGETITAQEWLDRLDALYNTDTTIRLAADRFFLSELAQPGTAVGVVGVLEEEVGEVTFDLVAGDPAGAFAISDAGVITVAGPIDRASQSSYDLTVQATDGVKTGVLVVEVDIRAAVGAETVLFDHEFDAPSFDPGDVRNQNGWTAQDGWGVNAGSEMTSSTAAYQGVTNANGADVAVEDVLRLEVEMRFDLGTGPASDLLHLGVTTRDSGDRFVPSLGNNGSSILAARIAYNGNDSNALTLWPDTTTVASQVELTGAQIGIDFGAGDRLTDELRITWQAIKTATAGVWDVEMVITNLDTGAELGRNTIPVTQSATYAAASGLFAGVRGLANSSNSTFLIDRFAYQVATPSAPLPGDYNQDGFVNAVDYSVFRDQLGQSGDDLTADSDGSGTVDEVDRVTWRSNYGLELPTAPATASKPIAGPIANQATASPLALLVAAEGEGESRSAVVEETASPAVDQEAALLLYLTGSARHGEEEDEAPPLKTESAEPPAIDEGLASLAL